MDPAAGFELRSVAHLIQPWGEPVRDLAGLREAVALAPAEAVFNHAVQYQLRHPGADELPLDDFSSWIDGVLQEREAAERLSFAVQTQGGSVTSTRAALLAVLDALAPKRKAGREAPPESALQLRCSVSVAFPTGVVAHDGDELVEAFAAADVAVWFYHLVEEPWFAPGPAPLHEWLGAIGERRLKGWLDEAVASGLPIEKARERLLRRWRRGRIARRVTDATAVPEDARREAGREAIARLVRRTQRPGEPS